MSEYPVKPKGMDEYEWYRETEKEIVLTVISADPHEGECGGCGERTILYQSQELSTRQIIARCKACTLKYAGGLEKLWVRTGGLRETWSKDSRNPKRATRRRRPEQPPVGVQGAPRSSPISFPTSTYKGS